MRRSKIKINYHILCYIILFLFFILYQTNRILQIKSPMDGINYLDYSSYLIYGLIILLIPIYIVFFIYIPSLLIIKVSFSFPKIQPSFNLTPILSNFKKASKQISYKSNFQLLCVMRC
ncbi:MAG: hypothetical protein K0Q49_66 [Haloplasmataceae bacterium]|jgi:flagellar biosynthesis protein FlhB|nr:hypothetical protein [Haloplasmataceae bacterium]